MPLQAIELPPHPYARVVAAPSRVGGAEVAYKLANAVLTDASGFMGAYDYTLNPYSGCSFGCAYCYAAFFSPTEEGRDTWGRWVRVKENAESLLRKKLERKPDALDGKLIYMSSVTDPYQPIERQIGLTRSLLGVMADGVPQEGQMLMLTDVHRPPADGKPRPKLVVQTRSPDVVRDCDLFRRIEENGGRVQVNMTVTTDDEEVRRTFEPTCPSNAARIRAIGEVHAAGVQACITMTPLLWASNPHAFADSLLATGVRQFIIQPFHHQRGKFVASTREQAVKLMMQKLGCARDAVRKEYDARYGEWYAVLEAALTGGGATLGVGKDGFAPPF